jgi:hypothetical protein
MARIFEHGSKVNTTVIDVGNAVKRYAAIRAAFHSQTSTSLNRQKLATGELLKLLNSDQLNYINFIRKLQLSPQNYPLFKGLTASPLEPTWERSTFTPVVPMSFGSDSEFKPSPELEVAFKKLDFLEKDVSFEEEGNGEVRSFPTSSLEDFFQQIDLIRKVGQSDLRSIHTHIRIPKAYYKLVNKAELSAWLSRIGDWIIAIRATEREGKWAFNQRTQGRNRVDEMNGWVDHKGILHRGTVRLFEIDDSIDIEIRGLMDGIFSKKDVLKDTINLLLIGLNNPELVHGYYQHRLINENLSGLEAVELTLKSASSGMDSKVKDFIKMIKESRNIDLLLAPFAGYEYLPFLSGHDVVTLTHAKERWTNELWWLLESSNTQNMDELREKYWKIVSNWYEGSNIKLILASSLLAKDRENLSWAQSNLPSAKLQSEYLKKILFLLEAGQAHSGIKLFLSEWFHRDRNSLVESSKNIRGELKSLLSDTLEVSNSTATVKNFKKAIEAPDSVELSVTHVMSTVKATVIPLKDTELDEIKTLLNAERAASNSSVSSDVWLYQGTLSYENQEKLARYYNKVEKEGNIVILEYLKPFLKNHFLNFYIHKELETPTNPTSLNWLLHLLDSEERYHVVKTYVEWKTKGWDEICQKKHSQYRNSLRLSQALEVKLNSGALEKMATLLTRHYESLRGSNREAFRREQPLIIAELDKIKPDHNVSNYWSNPSQYENSCNRALRR